MAQWMLVAVILGIAGALPMKSHFDAEQLIKELQTSELGRNSALENVIIDVLEDFRQIMVTGSDSIPVLDPFRETRIVVDDTVIPLPGACVEVNDLLVTKLSTFEMTEVSVTTTNLILQRYRAQVQGEIPVIDIEVGSYDLLVPFWGLDIFGKGDATISVVKPWLRVDTEVNLRLSILAIYLNIRTLRLDFGLTDIQFGITGMFNEPMVDDFVNRFLRNLILELAEFWTDEISDIISPVVLDVGNDILSDINLIDLIG